MMNPSSEHQRLCLLPRTGYLRINQIVGDKNLNIPPLIPVAKSTWWAGVRKGIYPSPIRLSPRMTVWRIEDICDFIEKSTESYKVKKEKP